MRERHWNVINFSVSSSTSVSDFFKDISSVIMCAQFLAYVSRNQTYSNLCYSTQTQSSLISISSLFMGLFQPFLHKFGVMQHNNKLSSRFIGCFHSPTLVKMAEHNSWWQACIQFSTTKENFDQGHALQLSYFLQALPSL